MGKIVFHYDNDISIEWNEGFTFNVFSEKHEIECFTDNTVKNISDAQVLSQINILNDDKFIKFMNNLTIK